MIASPRQFRVQARLLILASLLTACCSLLSTPAVTQQKPRRGKPPVPGTPTQARKGRATIVIDGTWKFARDLVNIGESAGWAKSPPPTAADTSIPALWTSQAAPGYSGTAWYWKTFPVPAEWKGQTVRVIFNAVADNASVWLNGAALGNHSGGVTPFEFNITKTIMIGQDNLLAVKVDGDAKLGAGIWQGVEVTSHDEAYIQHIFASADDFGGISANIDLLNTSAVTGDAELDCVVSTDSSTGKTTEVKKSNQNIHLTPQLNVTDFIASIGKKDLTLWSLDTPYLYAYQLLFKQGKDILDTDEVKFGCRSFGLKNGQITLNAVPIRLSAIAIHLELPVVIATTDDTDKAEALLKRAKTAGVTVLYLDAPNPAILQLADTTGVLIVEAPRPGLAPAARDAEMRTLVVRDRNHPCILGWSAGDCSADFAAELRQLDSTRFLLTGKGSALQLWGPLKDAPEKGPLPVGLMPVSP